MSMDINERMARLTETDRFRALLHRVMVEGPIELTEEATMVLAGVLCVDCRVRLKVSAVPDQPHIIGVELLHDTACPTWLAMMRARSASQN
jgi:hypothetical protein